MEAATAWTIAECCTVGTYRYIRCNLSLVDQCNKGRDSESFDGHQRLIRILKQGVSRIVIACVGIIQIE